MEEIPYLLSPESITCDHRMDVYSKNKIREMMSRAGSDHLCPICRELIDTFVSEGLITVDAKFRELEYRVDTLADNYCNYDQVREIAYDIALDTFKDRDEDIKDQIDKIKETVENIDRFRMQVQRTEELAIQINTTVDKFNNTIEKIIQYIDRKRYTNLRTDPVIEETLNQNIVKEISELRVPKIRIRV